MFIKVVVSAEILHRDFHQTLGNYYLSLTIAKLKFQNFTVRKFYQFLKALTMKLSIFRNKRTSHPEILIKVYTYLTARLQNDRLFQVMLLDASLWSGHYSIQRSVLTL